MSDSDEIRRMIYDLRRRFGGMERQVREQRVTQDDTRELVLLSREAQGLPVPSRRARMLARGVPAKLVALVEAGIDKTPAVAIALRLHAGEGAIAVLAGKAGRGKSAAGGFLLSLRAGLWVNAPALAAPPPNEGRGADIDARMRDCGLFVLDDAGKEYSPKGYAAARIADAIAARDHAELPTLITTNLGMAEFRDRYGDSVASRINGDGIGWQTIDGHDLRVTGQAHFSEVDRG